MKKHEVMTSLLPFTDELDLTVMSSDGLEIDIKQLAYRVRDDGVGVVTIIPMGVRLPKDEHWVEIIQ